MSEGTNRYLRARNTLVQLLALHTNPESHNAQRHRQTDGRCDDANSQSYCVAVRSTNKMLLIHRNLDHMNSMKRYLGTGLSKLALRPKFLALVRKTLKAYRPCCWCGFGRHNYHITSYRSKRQNRLKVGTDKPKLKEWSYAIFVRRDVDGGLTAFYFATKTEKTVKGRLDFSEMS